MKDGIAKLLGDWSSEITVGSTLLKIALAILFATVLGCERARNRHAAGLRTFMEVFLTATVAAIADLYLVKVVGTAFSFLSAATIIGIAVISSNTILFSSKNQLKGVTTSVALWTTAVIGIALGLGLYVVAIGAYFALLICLTAFTHLEKSTKKRSDHFEVHLELKSRNLLQEFTGTIRKIGLKIDDIEINPAYANSGLGVYSVKITVKGDDLKKKTHGEIIDALSVLECVSFIEEI